MSREKSNSNIYYLGYIPFNWNVQKYKSFADTRMGETILASNTYENGIPVYSATQEDKIFGYVNECNIKLKKGDLVIPARGNSIGCVSMIKEDVATCTQTTICSYNIRNINPKFLYFSILGLNNEWYKYDGSAIPQITVEQVKNCYLAVPPLSEQDMIVNYLDNKVSKISDTIKNNKKEIELLEEYKWTRINELLKYGFNNDTTNTKISYIKKVAKNWKIAKLGRIFEIKKDIAGKEGYEVLSITQNGIKVKDIQSNEGQLAADYSKYQLVEIGDFAMNHMDLLTGWVDCSKYNGVTSPDYRVFRNKNIKKYDSKFYLYFLQLCYKYKIFYNMGQGVSNLGRWRLPKENFLNTIIPVPSYNEQVEIRKYIDEIVTKIDDIINYRKQIIEKLEEYKKSLIYEAVTGKIEV
ncbi:MAG: restriction endonuclease subunit S [Clostridia bacterium]